MSNDKNKILIIEGDLTYQQGLKREFVKQGCGVECVSRGEDGLREAKKFQPDLIVLDLLLSGMDGREVCRQFRMDPAFRQIPIIMLTVANGDKTVGSASASGADSYLSKDEPIGSIVRRAKALLKLDAIVKSLFEKDREGGQDNVEEEINFAGKKILVVDDDLTFLHGIRRQLQEAGYKLLTAMSGEECFKCLKAEHLDIVLLDLRMPEIDGTDLCRQIRKIKQFIALPIVMLTASDSQEDIARSFEAGVDDYVLKSGNLEAINFRVRSILRRKHYEEENRRIQNKLSEAVIKSMIANAEKEAEKKHALDLEQRNTQLDCLNKTLDQKNEELKRLTQLKSEFLSTMSHELRTPLNAIIGFSEILKAQSFGVLNDKQKDYVNDVWESGKYLLSLINDILDLSKVEAGKMELELSEFNLQTVLPNCLVMVRERALYCEIEISLDVAPDVNVIVADERKLKQIINNLLSNAVKFTPKSGRIGFEVKRKNDQEILFSVWDSGVGIEEKDKDKIFQEFTRINNPHSRKSQGTGLGLVLTKKFIELHGGTIWFESEGKNRGTRFNFTLPAAPRSSVQNEPPAVEPIYKNNVRNVPDKTHVLLIEDDPKSAKLIAEYLNDFGCLLTVVKSGEEGLEKARSLLPSFIILDIILPHKDGWDILIELKMDPLTKDIPILVTSVVKAQGKGFTLGAIDYLIKPISKQDLERAIAKVPLFEKNKSRPTKIVVIDDEEISLKIMEAILVDKGFEVLTEQDSPKGLELIFREKPDLVLIDLVMPVMSGFDIIARLRSDPLTKDLPVIVVTAKILTEEEKEFLKAQTLSIIEKADFNKDSLLREINLIRGAETRGKA